MPQAAILQALAEAVTDGSDPDWASAESVASDARERALIGHMRAVAQIGRGRATLYSTGVARALAEAPLDLKPGDCWGPLRILEKVGRGRFGDVYRAWDPTLDRQVALKILRHRDSSTDDVVEEGRLMARVRHPNVITIYGAQRIDGDTGLWMEFVHGRTLEAELAERGPLHAASLIRVGVELCAALDAVHAAGLVHRDVKAQNVMRADDGRVVLGDFGTGRELDDERMRRAELAGTPVYLAPEIFANQPATPSADVYSLGVLLFHLATRDFPVKGRTMAALRQAHEARRVTSLRITRPDLPAELVAAVDRALDPDPKRRLLSASDLSRSLQVSTNDGARHKRMRVAFATTSVAALVLVALAGLAWRSGSGAETGPLEARDWVLVTSIANRTGESVLDGTLTYALERELSQSLFVNVVPRTRIADVLQLMQKPADTALDPVTSREVALRDGQVRALVTGSVDKVGDAYGVSVDIVNPTDGVLLASVSEPPMPQSELLRGIGRVAIALRARLGEGLPSVEASRLALAKVTTPSLKALSLFSQAVARQDEEGSFGGRARAAVAEQLLRAALAQDPGFASAHMLLSIAIRGPAPERLAEAVEHVKHAIALSEGVTEIERLVNEAELGIQWGVSTDLAERKRWQEYAIAKYEAVLQLQPNHTQALICLTNLYAEIRQPNARVAMQLAELRPHSSRWAAQAASAALLAGDFDAARTYAHRELAFAVTPAGVISEAWIRLFDAYDAWLRNDARAALAVADRVAEEFDRSRGTRASTPPNPDTGFARQLSSLYLILGRFERARAYAARMEPAARKLRSLDIAQHSENVELQKAVLALEYPRLEDSTSVINALIESGEIGKARLARDLFAKRANHSPAYLAFIDGQLAFVDGRLDEAIDKIGTYLKSHLPGRGHSVADKLAVALAAKGETARAIALLESFSHRASLVGSPAADRAYDWLPLRERLALLYRQVGRHRDADAIEAELRALLAVADDDHPIKQRLQQPASAREAR